MNRLTQKLAHLKTTDSKALSVFITAGFPSIDATVDIVRTLEENGADIIEIGIPFSDPLADGPTIQRSSEIALKNGINVRKVLDIVSSVRSVSGIPIVLMGYLNPLLAFGLDTFIEAAAAAGAYGLIIPDLPFEEASDYRRLATTRGLSTIFLAAPTTGNERLRALDEASTGFLYCVSITGVTGQREGLPAEVTDFLRRVRSCATTNPVLVGFGISGKADVRQLSPYCDGVIVGSALIQRILNSNNGKYLNEIGGFVKELREGLEESN
jgi:tryptophan synthase alpha chain